MRAVEFLRQSDMFVYRPQPALNRLVLVLIKSLEPLGFSCGFVVERQYGAMSFALLAGCAICSDQVDFARALELGEELEWVVFGAVVGCRGAFDVGWRRGGVG